MYIPLRWCQERHLTHAAGEQLCAMFPFDVTSGYWSVGKYHRTRDAMVVTIDIHNPSAVPGICYLDAMSAMLEMGIWGTNPSFVA